MWGGSSATGFESERLIIRHWHSFAGSELPESFSLPEAVAEIMTERVTCTLPPTWQGPYSHERASAWIDSLDADKATTVFLMVDKALKQALGLMILFEESAPDARVGVRIGYMLAETAWGKGYATEAVAALVSFCRESGVASYVLAGVAHDNPASARVLQKNGFQQVPDASSSADETMYKLLL